MAPGTKIKVAALVSATVAVMMVALTLATVTASAAQSIMNAYEFTPVGGSGLRGLGYVIKSGGKIRVQATLACTASCPRGPAAQGRFRIAEGHCGKPTGKSFTLKAGKLGPGGLDFHRTVPITPGNDLNPQIVKYEWDFNYNPSQYHPAACANTAKIAGAANPSVVTAVFGAFKPVGSSGLSGLGFAHKDGDKLRFHATLACAQACPTGSTGNGVPVRLKFAEGGCGKPTGESFALNFDKIDGFDSRSTRSFDPDNDPLTFWNSMRAAWDLDNNGAFEGAACAPKGSSYYYADGGWYYDYAYSG
jgi:hypothetical protein